MALRVAESSAARSPSTPPAGVGAVVIGGDYQGLGIARSLGRRGVPVVVLDDERAIAGASRYVRRCIRVANLRDEGPTLDALRSLRHQLPTDGWVLFPTRDETVATVARHRATLSPAFRLAAADWDSVRIAWDKRETYRTAAELGIPVPRSWFPRSEEDLADIDLSSPVVIKPAIKEHFFYVTHAKAWRVDDRATLRTRFREAAGIVNDGEVIVQELVPGDGQDQYSFCAFFKEGHVRASMTARRLRQHPSDFGRASTYVETVEVPEIEELASRFLRETGFYGLVELEFKHDRRDGRYKLLDVNARTWGYHSLGAAAGVDFPYLLYLDQIGHPAPVSRARPGVRWLRIATDVPNALRDIRAGRIALRPYMRTLRGIDVEAVYASDDPWPAAYEFCLLPYLAMRRGL